MISGSGVARRAPHASSCGNWSLSTGSGTRLGASPMALRDAIIATYMTIHMAPPPSSTTPRSRPHSVVPQSEGIAAFRVATNGNPRSVAFRQQMGLPPEPKSRPSNNSNGVPRRPPHCSPEPTGALGPRRCRRRGPLCRIPGVVPDRCQRLVRPPRPLPCPPRCALNGAAGEPVQWWGFGPYDYYAPGYNPSYGWNPAGAPPAPAPSLPVVLRRARAACSRARARLAPAAWKTRTRDGRRRAPRR
jgi:hypothetical protein